MSETETQPTVTPQRIPHGKSGMGIFGYIIFLGLVILLIPLVPLYLLLKLYELIAGDEGPVR
jgi:hypothetical protein